MGRNRPRSRAVDVTKSLLVPTGVADYIPVQVAPSQVVQVTEDELSPTQGSMNAAALRREGKLDAFVKLCTNWRNGSCHNHAACSFGHVLRYFNTGTPEGKGSAENNSNSNSGVYTMPGGGLSEEAAAAVAGGMLMMPGAVSEANKAALQRAGSTHSLSHTQSGNGLSWLQRLVPGNADPAGLVAHAPSDEAPCAPHAVCRTPSNAERHGVPSMKSVSELEVRSGDSFFGSNANLLSSMNNNNNISTISGNNSASNSRYLGITPRTSRTMEEEMRSGEDMGQGRTEAGLTMTGAAATSFTVYGPSTSARTNASTSTSNTTANNNNNTNTTSLMLSSGQRYGAHLSQHAPMNGTLTSNSLHHHHHHGGSTSPAMAGLERTRSTGRMSDVYVDWNNSHHSSHSQATRGAVMSPSSATAATAAAAAAATQSVWWGSAAAASAMNNGYPASPPSRRYTAPSGTTLGAVAVSKPGLPFLDPALVRGTYESSHGAAAAAAVNGVQHQQMPSGAGRGSERVQPSVLLAGRQRGSGQGTLDDWAAHGAWLDAANDRRRHGTDFAQGTHPGSGALGVNVGGAETWGVKSAHSPLHACSATEGGTASGINWAEGLKATALASSSPQGTTMTGHGSKVSEADRQACHSVPSGRDNCAVVAAPRAGGLTEGCCATQTEPAATEQTEEPARMPSKASLQHLMQLLTQGT